MASLTLRAHLSRLAIVGLTITGALAVSPAARSEAAARPRCGAATATRAAVDRTGTPLQRVSATFARPARRAAACSFANRTAASAEPPYDPTAFPPLENPANGPVMAAADTADHVTVTPIFWAPPGYSFPRSYEATIENYLTDVAADSGTRTNVFATLTQYSGTNGSVHYAVTAGAPIEVSDPFPSATCVADGASIYSDLTGYSACLDNDNIRTELRAIRNANSLPADLGHVYVMLLPRGVESCIYQGGVSGQACSLNSTPTSAYCGYHIYDGSTVFATLPFPVYASPLGQTCSSEFDSPGTSAPNGNLPADVEISLLSHEVSEAITDPYLNAWADSHGYENGDECAYIYGALSGPAGARWNQTINGHHYLTQEEFSNKEYAQTQGGCVQDRTAPTLTAMTPQVGPGSASRTVTIIGTGFRPGRTTVSFGSAAPSYPTVLSTSKLTVPTPVHAPGLVHVTVATPNRRSKRCVHVRARSDRDVPVPPRRARHRRADHRGHRHRLQRGHRRRVRDDSGRARRGVVSDAPHRVVTAACRRHRRCPGRGPGRTERRARR
jgi:hypothetical protein